MSNDLAMPVSGKRNVKAELTRFKREQILEVATRLFLENGYHGVSLDSVAAQLGVSKPFIYYQFRDKAEILTAICQFGADLTLSAVIDAEAQPGNADSRMAWFCRRLTEIVIDNGHYVTVYAREIGNIAKESRQSIVKIRDEIDHRIARQIAVGAQAGLFNVADPLVATRAITGMLSFIPVWHREKDGLDREQLAAMMTEISMRTLRPSSARLSLVAGAAGAGRKQFSMKMKSKSKGT